MVLKVDDEHIDLILIDGEPDLVETLRQIREAAELGLDGLRKRP